MRLPIGWLSQISLPNLIFIPAAGKTIDDAALINLARERLAGFETPKRIVILHEFPTTVGGKIVKYKIRQMLNEPAS